MIGYIGGEKHGPVDFLFCINLSKKDWKGREILEAVLRAMVEFVVFGEALANTRYIVFAK